MKPLPLIIAVSIAANAALAFVVFSNKSGALSSSTSSSTDASSPGAGAVSSERAASKKNDDASVAGVDPKLWGNLNTTELPDLVARLRAAGFPPSVVRAIVSAQVRASFEAKRKALFPAKGQSPFWKADVPADSKTRIALRDLNKEQNNLLNELFGGPDPDTSLMMSVYERRQYGNLPAEKVDQLSRVKRDYDEMRSDIFSAASGGGGGMITMLPEDRAKLALLEKEQRADFAQILSPQELEDYDLRSSNTANQMRYSLSAFNPSEAEFRTIFKLQRELDEKTGAFAGGATQEQMRQRAEAQKALQTQIQAALGPERGKDYERAIDYNYQQINNVVTRLELPKTAVNDVWDLKTDVEKRAMAVRTNRDLKPEERNAQLAALSQEATTKLSTALGGQRGLDIYKQYGGYWLQGLQPRPAGAPNTGTSTMQFTPGG